VSIAVEILEENSMNPNSYANYLLGLYSAMLVDIADKCPHLHVDSIRDFKRLLSAVDSRGLKVFLKDLPEIGKHFDRCLADGQLTRSGLPLARPYKTGVVIPRLFKGLLLSVFNSNGVLRDRPDKESIKFLRQLYHAAKRFYMDCPDSSTWKTVDEFFRTDQECRLPTSDWFGSSTSFEPLSDVHLCDISGSQLPSGDIPITATDPSPRDVSAAKYVAQWAADIVAGSFDWFEPTEWRAKHGPGAVSDLGKESSKYEFPSWPESLESIFPYADMGFSSYEHWADSSKNQMEQEERSFQPSSKLIAVPKTINGPRLIASEPTSYQWCQQTVLDFLVHQVAKSRIRKSIDFRSQTKNAELALEASHTEKYATIDLSAASDRVSCWLVERVFRRNPRLLQSFYACRTRYIRNEIDRESPSMYILRKFTTMGSALTFPTQTIIFTLIAIGCVVYIRQYSLLPKSIEVASEEVQVFGDDIIVPTDCWPLVQAVLEDLGLKVNPNKTFGTGKFRESCGCDAYDGDDVTKVSVISMPVVSRPGSIMSSVDTHNNFLLKGYYRTAEYIKTTVHQSGRYAIPDVVVGSGSFGWYSFDQSRNSSLKSRWNSLLHRKEYLVHRALTCMTRRSTETCSMVLQYFTEVCKPPTSHEERLGVPSRPAHRLVRRWVPERDLLY
jgi:hypothetical protein